MYLWKKWNSKMNSRQRNERDYQQLLLFRFSFKSPQIHWKSATGIFACGNLLIFKNKTVISNLNCSIYIKKSLAFFGLCTCYKDRWKSNEQFLTLWQVHNDWALVSKRFAMRDLVLVTLVMLLMGLRTRFVRVPGSDPKIDRIRVGYIT